MFRFSPFGAVVVLEPLRCGCTCRGCTSCDCHHNATCCATVGDRPRWVTFMTSTPLVITSFKIASPSSSRATRTGIGPSPRISHDLFTLDRTADERFVVEADDPEILRRRPLRLRSPSRRRWCRPERRVRRGVVGAGGAAGELDERVERVRLERLFAPFGLGELELLVDQRLPLRPELGAVVERSRGRGSSRRLRRPCTPGRTARDGSARASCPGPWLSPSGSPREARRAASSPPPPTTCLPRRDPHSPHPRSHRPSPATTCPYASAFAVLGSFFTRLDVLSCVLASLIDVPDNSAN